MLPEYDIVKLEHAIYDFNKATGVSVTLFDRDKKAITFSGAGSCKYCASIADLKQTKHSCSKSNNELLDMCRKTKQPQKHICKAGLLDIAIPLLHLGEIVGYLMIGRIKQFPTFPAKLSELGANSQILKQQYDSLPLIDDERINSIINIGTMLTGYIMLENMVRSQPSRIQAVLESYIDEHLGEHISMSSLSEATHTSVSGIYKCIRRAYGCTPGELICAKRLERASSLLLESELSISEIAELTGFSDTAHFSKNFKKAHGVSPLKYRKNAENCN